MSSSPPTPYYTTTSLLHHWNPLTHTYNTLPILSPKATFPTRYLLAYGSLTSTHSILSSPRISRYKCLIHGYKRMWCVRSSDHRGTTRFGGIVMTLLSKRELQSEGLWKDQPDKDVITEGVVYEIPDDLQEYVQKELDNKEKGGYGRDILEAELCSRIENNDKDDDNNEKKYNRNIHNNINKKKISCLTYRVTPSSPSYWKRTKDPYFTSAILSSSSGPSGSNLNYIKNISKYVSNDSHTSYLYRLCEYYSDKHVYYFFGKGKNEENQLQLNSYQRKEYWEEVTEIMISVDMSPYPNKHNKTNKKPNIVKMSMGHSHMALLFQNHTLYMLGTNEHGQLGTTFSSLFPYIQNVSCGQYHTLYQSHHKVYISGCNTNGRVSGKLDSIDAYIKLHSLEISDVVSIQAGWCHSIIMTPKKTIILGQYNVVKESLYREYTIVFDRVFGGYYYTIGIKDNMDVYSMGRSVCLGRESDSKDYDVDFGKVNIKLKLNKKKDMDVNVTCGKNQVWLLCKTFINNSVYTWGYVNRQVIQNPIEYRIESINRIRELYCKSEEVVLIVDEEGQFWEGNSRGTFRRVRGCVEFGEKSDDGLLIGMGFGWWMGLRA